MMSVLDVIGSGPNPYTLGSAMLADKWAQPHVGYEKLAAHEEAITGRGTLWCDQHLGRLAQLKEIIGRADLFQRKYVCS